MGCRGTSSDTVKIALLMVVSTLAGASIVIYGLHTTAIDNLSSELEEKSLQIDQQSRQIDQYIALVSAQQQELADKRVQLESLQGEIGILTREIELQERQITARAAHEESLRVNLSVLEQQAASLEQEIALLQSEMQSNDLNITELLLANNPAEHVHMAHYGLGVTEDGNGVVFPIEVDIIGPGAGRIFVDVSDVQYEALFQEAVRTAAQVASGYTGISMSDRDIVVRLVNESDGLIIIDGPSAGAVVAVMVVAGIEGGEKNLDPDVLVTGSIMPDGTIGSVGHVSGKAEVAADFGAKTLLVPDRQEFYHSGIEVEGVKDIAELAERIIVES